MDGFDATQNVIVLAATNRPDVLDPALLRPGRFDRQVTVDLLDRRGREAILRVHTRAKPLAPDVDLAALAHATPGMSGADLANLANEAAMVAARTNAAQVTQAAFAEAFDRITLGAPGAALLNEDERRTVSYHEAGHALVALLLPQADPATRVTITPRGCSLGVTQFRPIDERRTYRRDYLRARLAVGLGGRAAEDIACEEITSGAQNDLQEVTRLAGMMVTQLGMVDAVGRAYLGGSGDDALEGGPFTPWTPRAYSDETARHIDAAIKQLIADAYATARTLLSGNRRTLDALAAALLREESLDSE
jgi:cell division protease FtsH